jgi:hypothetical protein
LRLRLRVRVWLRLRLWLRLWLRLRIAAQQPTDDPPERGQKSFTPWL